MFDTFDRDLWFADVAVCRVGSELAAYTIGDLLLGDPLATAPQDASSPRFWWDVAESPLRDLLRRHLKLRAIQSLVTIGVKSQQVDVRNSDEKTVVRLLLQTITGTDDKDFAALELCRIQPLRGYGKEANQLTSDLAALGLYHTSSPVGQLVGELAVVPEAHPARYRSSIASAQAGRSVVTDLLRERWQYARTRETGICRDIDTEFLHEYRVALRRIRSLVSLSKGVFPDDTTMQLKNDFRKLARQTNRLRDLDVYLLKQDRYREILPHALQEGICQMFTDFELQRQKELCRVREHLTSERYRDHVATIDTILTGIPYLPQSRRARMPAFDLASEIIQSRYRKIYARGRKINDATPDDAVHDLRIECKKLRYALEFFGPLLAQDCTAATLKRLKKLQDSLGDFNDLCVQQESLAEYLHTKQTSGEVDTALAASVGCLIGTLYQRSRQQRTQLGAKIKTFCSQKVSATFNRLGQQSKRAA